MNRRFLTFIVFASLAAVPARTKTGGSAPEFGLIQIKSGGRTAAMLQTMLGKEFVMWTRNLALLFAAAVALGGCASAGGGASAAPYAGPHNHLRDAKQGPAPSTAQPAAPSTRKSLRPVS